MARRRFTPPIVAMPLDSRLGMTMLPSSARIAIGLVVLAVGGALGAFGATAILHPAPDLRIVALPAGLVFVFAGALVLLPPRLASLQLPLTALMTTALAVVFDWVAFGPGERRFSGSASVPGISVGGPTSELPGRIFFGLFALLFDLAAVGLWIQYVRSFFRAKAPLDHG